jgi:hypothetical protein
MLLKYFFPEQVTILRPETIGKEKSFTGRGIRLGLICAKCAGFVPQRGPL